MQNLFDDTTTQPTRRTRKPVNQAAGHSDHFQTPAWALEPLFTHLKAADIFTIWEPARGKGNIVNALHKAGFCPFGTDILDGDDFLTYDLVHEYDCIITNPPFSLKDQFLARCYELGKPFALLLPFTALEGQFRQSLYRQYGVEVIVLPKRVNFETPSGNGSSAWFPTAWFTHGLNIGQQLTFATLKGGKA